MSALPADDDDDDDDRDENANGEEAGGEPDDAELGEVRHLPRACGSACARTRRTRRFTLRSRR